MAALARVPPVVGKVGGPSVSAAQLALVGHERSCTFCECLAPARLKPPIRGECRRFDPVSAHQLTIPQRSAKLAHAERNKVRAAYNRAQRLDERRKMMQAWSDYLDGLRAGANVLPIKHGA